jgi:cytochrome P450
LSELLGHGVLTAEGASHRRQRRVLNPAFSPATIAEMGPILWDKAHELRSKLVSLIEDDAAAAHEAPAPTPPTAMDVVKGARKVDILRYMSKFTLAVIGTAGFGYEFNTFGEAANPLAEAFNRLIAEGQKITLFRILQVIFPVLRVVRTKNNIVVAESRSMCDAIGRGIVERAKRAIEAEYSGGFAKNTDMGKDLLSLLMKANMAPDLRADQRLSDDEVLAQITTFMLAGSETTSVSASWALWRLVLNPDIQQRLREEVRAVSDDRPSL